MARKKTLTAAKKTRGGTSKQHAKAGRLGGLAPHVCRGSECTKLRREAAAKKRSLKAAVKPAAKAVGTAKKAVSKLVGALKASSAKKAAKAKTLKAAIHHKVVKAKKSAGIHARHGRPGFFEELFEDVYTAPKRTVAKKKTTASRTKKAAPKRAAVKRAAPKGRRRKLA